jgi:plastocyanin
MRRRLLLLAVTLAAAVVAALFTVPAAFAGGGCHEPATDVSGATVTMKNMCFTPTVLRVPAGGKVTFVNSDSFAHPTMGRGLDWFVDGATGSRSSVQFDKPGIFPYFCHEHIGMVGVVVVGDGKGSTAAAAPAVAADPPAAAPAAISAAPASARRSMPWSVPGALVVAVVLVGAGVVVGRRRRPRSGPAAPQV